MASPGNLTTQLEFTLYPRSIGRWTRSNRETATRWVQASGSIVTGDIDRLFHIDDPPLLENALEVTIYEWKDEPLTEALDPAQIGAYRPTRRSVRFRLHPEAFAEMWAAAGDKRSGAKLGSVTLELKATIDPDLYAVVEVTFAR